MIFQPVLPEWILATFGLTLIVFACFHTFKNLKLRNRIIVLVRRVSIVLILTILALRPGVGEYKEVEILTNQYDVYFVVDTSASIVAEDWGDNNDTRLSAVKSDIGRLVDEYAGARYSLITFDSQGLLRTPLTKNASAVMTSVNILQPEITKYSVGSNLGSANEVLEKTLRQSVSVEPDRAKLVFFFTDGEQTSMADIGSYANIQQYVNGGMVYGYGTVEGGKMLKQNGYVIVTNEDSPYIMDESISPPVEALSKLNEDNLRNISEELGLEYVIRDADTPIMFPLVDPGDLSSDITQMNTITDYSWLVASMLLIIVAFEVAYIFKFFIQIRKRNESKYA